MIIVRLWHNPGMSAQLESIGSDFDKIEARCRRDRKRLDGASNVITRFFARIRYNSDMAALREVEESYDAVLLSTSSNISQPNK